MDVSLWLTRKGRAPRIAFSGSAGTGKTTLAERLAERWQVPYQDEGMRRRLEAGLDMHQLSRDQYKALLRELADENEAGLEAARSAGAGLVCDRAPLDTLAFWIHYGLIYAGREESDAIAKQQLARCTGLDLIVLLPWGALPLVSDGVRSDNPWLQLQFQTLVEGLAREFLPPESWVLLPKDITSLDQRIDWIEDRLFTLSTK
ncbi:MAG: ATP-binding protein [Pseudomonadota bacterium]